MDKIYLYPTEETDFEDYYTIRSDPGDVYWNGYASPPEKESFKEVFYTKTGYSRFELPEDRRNYLVKETESDLPVGFLQLIRRDECIELGYSVLTEYQGRGYGTEALKQGILIAKQYNLPIIVRIRDDNIPSQRVAEKNGFVRTHTFHYKECFMAGIVKLRTYILREW